MLKLHIFRGWMLDVIMTEPIKIDYTTDLIDGKMLTALITISGRQFEMTVGLGGSLSCRSIDGKAIPLEALWSGYCTIHTEAMKQRDGKQPESFNPEDQIKKPLFERDDADGQITRSSVPPKELRKDNEGDDR